MTITSGFISRLSDFVFPTVHKEYSAMNSINRKLMVRICAVLLLALAVGQSSSGLLVASDQIPGATQSRPIAIVGATLHLVGSETMESGVIVFENGKITQLGKNITLPTDCETIDGENRHVYPSMIEAYSDIGLVEINSVDATIDNREIGDFNPNVRAAAAFNPDSELIPVNRANGILLALTAPNGGILSGRSSMMMLDGWTWEDMTLQADVGMHVRWPRNDEGVKELAKILEQAKRYSLALESGESKPKKDLRLDALLPVIHGDMPVIVDASSLEEIEQAVGFCNQYEIKLIIHGGTDAPKCAKLLKSQGIPVIVSSVYRNPSRRHEPYDAGYELPKLLHDAGVEFCISAGGRFGASGVRNLPYHAATAAAYGLPEAEALEAITSSAAKILGVDDRVGSLQVGLDATLILTDGNILETPTQVEMAFIQGRKVDLDNKHQQLYRKYSEKYSR